MYCGVVYIPLKKLEQILRYSKQAVVGELGCRGRVTHVAICSAESALLYTHYHVMKWAPYMQAFVRAGLLKAGPEHAQAIVNCEQLACRSQWWQCTIWLYTNV
jgi:hypothetical protein